MQLTPSSVVLADATPSLGPSLALIGVGLLALASIGLGARTARGARSSPGWRTIAAASALFTLGVFAAGCVAGAFRHFGGTTGGEVGARVHICEAWWDEVSTVRGVSGGDTTPSPACRASAINPFGPAVIDSAAVAVAAGAVTCALLVVSRRRLDESLARPTTT